MITAKQLSPIDKLDMVLGFIKQYDALEIANLPNFIQSRQLEMSDRELHRVCVQLLEDKYIFEEQDCYAISLKGYLFMGYKKQQRYDRIINRNRRIRTFVLAWGIVLAGIAAAAVFAWQVYSYYHPQPSPFDPVTIVKKS